MRGLSAGWNSTALNKRRSYEKAGIGKSLRPDILSSPDCRAKARSSPSRWRSRRTCPRAVDRPHRGRGLRGPMQMFSDPADAVGRRGLKAHDGTIEGPVGAAFRGAVLIAALDVQRPTPCSGRRWSPMTASCNRCPTRTCWQTRLCGDPRRRTIARCCRRADRFGAWPGDCDRVRRWSCRGRRRGGRVATGALSAAACTGSYRRQTSAQERATGRSG